MAKKVQLMTNAKEWQTVDGVEVSVDVPQEDLDPVVDSSCVEIEGHRTLEETISQENMFTPEIVETKVHSKVGGVYHDNVVDGAYEEAILYGNTQVNLVESMTSGTKYIPHSFTSFQGNESKIGNYNSGRTNQVAPLVKGVTMVNLCQETSLTIQYQHTRAVANRNAKPNTKYTLKCKFTEKNKNAGIMIQSYGYKDGTWGYIEISKTIQNLGDDVLLTFTTHEQADSIIIYNNPAFCEDANDSITLDDIMVIEGDVTDLDLPFFKGMRSVELSRPLTNLFTDSLKWGNQGTIEYTNSGGNVTVTSNSIQSWSGITFYFATLKQNTKYLVMWDSLTQTQTSTTSSSIIAVYDVSSNTNIGTANSKEECPTLRSIVFDTTGRNYTTIGLRVHATLSNSETGTTTVKGLRIFEWDDSLRTLDLQTIGYFSGTKYVSARALETEGKNLYPYGDVNFTNDYVGWCDAKGKTGMYGDIAQKSSTRFLLKKGTYTFSIGSTTNVELIYIVDDKEQQVGHLGQELKTFTLAQDTYCTIRVKTVEANVATTVTNIQIERGETATTYEAYHSRYYKPRETEEIILRSLPNGVCDTFNLQTGELVQKIGEVVLDGSEYWAINATYKYFCNSIRSDHKSRSKGGMAISDKIIYLSPEQIVTNSIRGFSLGGSEFIQLCEPSCATVDELKTYLQSNPITVQYELAEPIITKLQTYDRIYSGQTNARAPMGNNLSALTYYSNNYYLKVGNLSPIPAILEPITSIPYDVRLKPSTLYTVKYNRGGNSNSMSFDLGGSVVEKTNTTDLGAIAEELTVRTPAILSHEQLILSGTGFAHNFIVVEGDIISTELPYFEGMKDVKMPIVKNIGKNLFDIQSIYQELKNIEPNNVLLLNDDTLRIKSTGKWHNKDLGKPIKFKENTRYTLSFNAQDIDNIGGLPDTIICFVYTDGTTSFNRAWGDNVFTSTVGKTVDYINFSFGFGDGRMAEFSNFMLVEGTQEQPYANYKENSIYITQGEYPITSEMIEQGGFSTGDGTFIEYEEMKYEASIRLRSKDLIPVKPNTTYHIDATNMGGQLVYNVYQWNGNRGFMEGYTYTNNDYKIPFTFTTTADTQYIHILCSKYGNGAIAVADYDWNNFHMYELDSTINLRSLPNGVKDELNLLTGEYIQRVGEVVLDGSENWSKVTWEGSSNLFELDFRSYNAIHRLGINLLCDKLDSEFITGTTRYGIGTWASNEGDVAVTIAIRNGKETIQDFKASLASNPITVQYELAEPIISHVRLVSNNQEREVGVKLPNGVSNTYNPSTGITTVRVGKVVLDGSEDWKEGGFSNDTYCEGWLVNSPFAKTMASVEDISFINGNFVTMFVADGAIPHFNLLNSLIHGGINIKNTSNPSDPGAISLIIQKSKMTTPTLDGFKQYLASNPITVWYELKYPQIQPDIVLPNGVHDEYNPETGVYTKKVGFAEFDGSEDEGWTKYSAVNTGGLQYFRTPCPLMRVSDNQAECKYVLSDSITVVPYSDLYNGLVTLDKAMSGVRSNSLNKPCIYIYNSEISDESIFKTSLSQNPVKVWYELATPITYQLTPYFGLPQPYAYEDGYLIHDSAYSKTTLPPEFKYKLVANRTGQVMQNNRKLQEHTTRLSNLEALIIEATIQSLFDRELQTFELELMDIQLIDLGE